MTNINHINSYIIVYYIYILLWLVVSAPLKNISQSVGMIIPNIWKNNPNVPNHQPDIYIYMISVVAGYYLYYNKNIIYIYNYLNNNPN